MDGWMVGWMGGWMDGWIDGWVEGWVDGCLDGWTVGWMGGWMDGWSRKLRKVEGSCDQMDPEPGLTMSASLRFLDGFKVSGGTFSR